MSNIQTPLNWTITDAAGTALIDNQLTMHPEISVLPGQYQVSVSRPEDDATATLRVEVTGQDKQAILILPERLVPASLAMNAREQGVNGMIGRDLVWTLYAADGTVVLDHVTTSTASAEVLPGTYHVAVLRP